MIDKLLATCPLFLGLEKTPEIEETNKGYRLKNLENAVGACFKQTGTCWCTRISPPEGGTPITSAKEAVNVALDTVGQLGILKLGEEETLDLTIVSTTQPEGSFTLDFGRRLRGIPLLNSWLQIEVSPSGVVKHYSEFWWRTVAKSGGEPIALLDAQEIGALRNPDWVCYPITQVTCGYVENDLPQPGIGCRLLYKNLDAHDQMNSKIEEWLNIAVDGDPPLGQ